MHSAASDCSQQLHASHRGGEVKVIDDVARVIGKAGHLLRQGGGAREPLSGNHEHAIIIPGMRSWAGVHDHGHATMNRRSWSRACDREQATMIAVMRS